MAKNTVLWWEATSDNIARVIFDLVRTLHNESDDREQRNIRAARLYGNREFTGINPLAMSQSSTPSLPENRVKINIVSSMCDTAAAKISKMRPKVTFLTSGGDWTLQQNTKKLTTFMNGLFYKNKVYQWHQAGFRDSTVFDIGAVKHYIQDGQIVSERTLATELLVEPADAMYGSPRSLYQYKFVHKSILTARFPDKKAIIDMSVGTLADANYGRE